MFQISKRISSYDNRWKLHVTGISMTFMSRSSYYHDHFSHTITPELKPSNAEANFGKTMFENHLNPVMSVLIG